MAKVIIRIKNGIADSIEDIPTDLSVEVGDYDVANVADDQLTKDADGTRCYVREWRAPE
jgi:hypothetical protein